MIEISSLIVAIVGAVIAWKTFKRTPKLPEPKTYYGSPTIYGVKMKEPPGLPGYDRERRNCGFSRFKR